MQEGRGQPGLGARGRRTAERRSRGTRRAEGDRRQGHGHPGPQCGGCSTELRAGGGRGVQGLTTTPHGRCVCFPAIARVGRVCFATDGAVAPGQEALGTDDIGGRRLNSPLNTAMLPEGEIKPTRSQTKTPRGRVGTGKVRVHRGILFQNCIKRLKICVIERVTSCGSPQSGFPSVPERETCTRNGDQRARSQGGACTRGLTWRVRLQNTDSISPDPCSGPASWPCLPDPTRPLRQATRPRSHSSGRQSVYKILAPCSTITDLGDPESLSQQQN